MKSSKHAVLVYRVGQLGDTLVAIPAIDAIRRRHPEHRMVLLTNRYKGRHHFVSSWDVLQPTGWFSEVIYYTPDRSLAGTLKNMLVLAAKLRPMKFEHIYDLSPDRTPRRSRRDRFFFERLVRATHYHQGGPAAHPEKPFRGSLPAIQPEWSRLLDIACDGQDAGWSMPPYRLAIPEDGYRESRALLETNGIASAQMLIAVGPGSNRQTTRWPEERFFETGKRILDTDSEGRYALVVLGGSEDSLMAQRLCDAWGQKAYNFAGKLSIYGSAAILQRSSCYIVNDTGTMHLAGLVGTPCVAIHSARNHPRKWEPCGDEHVILRPEATCEGCGLDVCKQEIRCIDRVTVDEVVSRTLSVLSRKRHLS